MNGVKTVGDVVKLEATCASPTFTRASTAYLSDGTQVAANVPRFEDGKFGKAIMVEEGTTNVCTNGSFESNLTGWTFPSGQYERTSQEKYFGSYSLKLTNPDSSTSAQAWFSVPNPSSYAGKTVTVTVYAKTDRPYHGRLEIKESDDSTSKWTGSNWHSGSGQWEKLTLTMTFRSTVTDIQIQLLNFVTTGDNTPTSVYFDGVLFEQKPYPTSFHPTTRSPEVATIPTAGVLSDRGPWTVECWAKANHSGSSHRMPFAAWNKFYVSLNPSDKPQFSWVDANNVQQFAIATNALNNPTGWLYWAFTWDGVTARIYVDGVKVIEVETDLPKPLPAYLTVGWGAGGYYWNGLINDLRISSRARTDAEILAAYQSGEPLPLDGDTTYRTLDGSLDVAKGGSITRTFNVSSAEIANTSSITWNATVPTGTSLTIQTSLRKDSDFSKLSNPTILPTGLGYGCTFSPCGTYLAVAHSTSPYITIYKRDGDTFTKLTNPASLPPNTARSCSFSPCGTYLAVAHSTSPYITIYKRDGDTFARLGDPTTLPTGSGYGCSFSPDGVYLAIAHSTSPHLTIYKRSGDTFTKLTNPASLPPNVACSCSFSPCGTYLSVAHYVSPYLTIYKRDGDVFTKLSNPASLPPNVAHSCSFSPDGVYLAIAHSTSPYLTIYKRDGDVFTKLSNPVLPSGIGRGCVFSPDDTYLVVAHYSSPFITIYRRDGDTFTKLTDPSTVLPNTGYGCGFSPDNVHLVMTHYDSPYITIYKTPPWSEWKTATKGQAIPDVVKHRNLKESSLRYKATLTTSDIDLTPQLQDITLSIYGNVVDIMYADTYRQVAFGESSVYIADTLRIVVTKQGHSADTLREVNALLHGYFGDTSRKPALPYDYSADTLRKVASGVLFIDSENILQPLGWYVSGLPLPKLAIRDYSEQIPEHHGEIDHGFDLDVGDYMLTIVSPRTTDKEKLRRELMYAFQTSWGVRGLKIYNTTYKVRLDGSIQIKQLPHYIIAEVPLKVGR